MNQITKPYIVFLCLHSVCFFSSPLSRKHVTHAIDSKSESGLNLMNNPLSNNFFFFQIISYFICMYIPY